MASESVGLEAMFFVDGEKAQAVLSFGPSASLHRQGGAYIARLRPRVASVLRATPLTTMQKSTVAIPCLPARSTHKTFAPLPLTSLAGTTNLSSAWDYLPSYGMGPYTIVRFGTIGYRTDSLFQIANTPYKDKHLIINILQIGGV